jgi:hypothetical protein
MAKLCFSWVKTVKCLEAQQTRIPPETPIDGQKSKLSNVLGEKFLMN